MVETEVPLPPNDDVFLLGVALLAIRRNLHEIETEKGHEERAMKMQRVADDLAAELERDGAHEVVSKTFEDLLEMLPGESDTRWSERERIVYLVELATTPPFAPNELKYSRDDFWKTLTRIADRIGVVETQVQWLKEWLQSAESVHKNTHLGHAALLGLGAGAVVAAVTAGLALPVIAPWFAAAGLSGTAAILSGLTAIGGGAVAANGLGLAGGMWILTGAGFAVGGVAVGTTAAVLGAFDYSAAITEIVKAQVAFKLLYVDDPQDGGDETPGRAIDAVVKQRTETETLLRATRDRNEGNSHAVKNVEAVLEALNRALKWMHERQQNASKERP